MIVKLVRNIYLFMEDLNKFAYEESNESNADRSSPIYGRLEIEESTNRVAALVDFQCHFELFFQSVPIYIRQVCVYATSTAAAIDEAAATEDVKICSCCT